MLAKGKVLGWRGGSRADGGWKYLPQAPGCCLSTISKGANGGEFLWGNSCAGKKAVLLFVKNAFSVQVTTQPFWWNWFAEGNPCQPTSFLELQRLWVTRKSEYHAVHPLPQCKSLSCVLVEGHLYLLEPSSGREFTESTVDSEHWGDVQLMWSGHRPSCQIYYLALNWLSKKKNK